MTERSLTLLAGTTTITPSQPGALAGYRARLGVPSVGTLDELEASLLVLTDAHLCRVAWLTLDAIGVTDELANALRDAVREGLEDGRVHVVVAASHTHSAPLGWTGGLHAGDPGPRIDGLVAELLQRIRALGSRLLASAPLDVEARWSTAQTEGVGTNRHAPDGPHDRSVGVLTLRRRADGAVAAVLFDLATHPTVLGAGNLRWSADWPGAARLVLREALCAVDTAAGRHSPPPVIAFLQGAAGDVSTRFTRRTNDAAEVARLGALAAATVLAAVEAGGRVLKPRLGVATEVIIMPTRALPDAAGAAADLAVARSALDAMSGDPLDPAVRVAQTRLDGAEVQAALVVAGAPSERHLRVTAVVLDDVAWAMLPVEPFASIGFDIDRSTHIETRTVGYADGYAGYLVDAPAREAGTYEALSTLFPDHAAGTLTGALGRLIRRAARSATDQEGTPWITTTHDL